MKWNQANLIFLIPPLAGHRRSCRLAKDWEMGELGVLRWCSNRLDPKRSTKGFESRPKALLLRNHKAWLMSICKTTTCSLHIPPALHLRLLLQSSRGLSVELRQLLCDIVAKTTCDNVCKRTIMQKSENQQAFV